MSATPKDLFLGITEFFSLLLPGAILLGLFRHEAQEIGAALNVPTDGAAGWFAFAVASYVLGHALHAAGSGLDKAYDRWYAAPRRKRYGEERLLVLARELQGRMFGTAADATGVMSWAGSFVRVMSPSAAGEIEARSSESKFFRSLIPVLSAAAIVLLWRGALTAAVIGLLLLSFAIWRYCDRRWDSVQLTYEYYVLLAMLNEKAGGSRQASMLNTSA